jgi:hypothetical protein
VFSLQILIGGDFTIMDGEKFGQESEGPQWVQCKAMVRVQVEAPQPIFDLVNFDLLLRVFPNFKIVSFCLILRNHPQ